MSAVSTAKRNVQKVVREACLLRTGMNALTLAEYRGGVATGIH